MPGLNACAADCFRATEGKAQSMDVRCQSQRRASHAREAIMATASEHGCELFQASDRHFPWEIRPMQCIGKTPA